MSCLFKRSNGIWYVVYPVRNRRTWLSTGTRCFGKAYGIFRTCPSGSDRRRPTTISGFLADLEAYASANYSKGTRSLYAHSIKAFARYIGDKPMRFVTVKDVERYKTERVKTVSPVSVNVEFRTLRAAFNTALRWEVISKNVFTESKQLRVPIKEPAYLTKQEFNTLLRVIKEEEFRDLIVFTAFTMLRRSEVANLEWSDIDLDRRTIRVQSKGSFVIKGGHPRTVPMNRTVYDLLLGKRKRGSFVFVGPDGCQFKAGYISHAFKAYVRQCGLPEAIRFHSLRHSGATWLIQQEVSLYSVQKILGHTTPEMTQVYSHLSDENLRQAIEQIDFGPAHLGMN